jgi:hypothetical protein
MSVEAKIKAKKEEQAKRETAQANSFKYFSGLLEQACDYISVRAVNDAFRKKERESRKEGERFVFTEANAKTFWTSYKAKLKSFEAEHAERKAKQVQDYEESINTKNNVADLQILIQVIKEEPLFLNKEDRAPSIQECESRIIQLQDSEQQSA